VTASARSRRDRAAGRGSDVRSEVNFEAGDVAIPGRRGERLEKTPMLGRIRGHLSGTRDVPPGASHHLARVGLFKLKNIRDVAVWIVEGFPKDVGGSFDGRQLFVQQQKPNRQRLASFRVQPSVGAGIDCFRCPGSNVRLSARAC